MAAVVSTDNGLSIQIQDLNYLVPLFSLTSKFEFNEFL